MGEIRLIDVELWNLLRIMATTELAMLGSGGLHRRASAYG